MSAPLSLSPDDLQALTGRTWRSRQMAWLEARGVPYRLDGKRILVARSAAEAYLRGERMVQSRSPDLSMVR